MESNEIVCVKFKGNKITKSVESGFIFNFDENRDFENLL